MEMDKKIGSPLRTNGLRGKGGECKLWSQVIEEISELTKTMASPVPVRGIGLK